MTPYYEQDGITIYHGDCLEVLPQLPQVDAVITDPPYNVGLEYASQSDNKPDYPGWCTEWFQLLRSRCIALTPGISNLGMWHGIATPSWVMCWHKPAAMGRCAYGFNNWEPILCWGAPRNPKNDVVTATIVPDKSIQGHPCPKPLGWAIRLLDILTNEGDTILDPFLGSGTTAVAALYNGRRAIGIEIEERYCEIAANRLRQKVLF